MQFDVSCTDNQVSKRIAIFTFAEYDLQHHPRTPALRGPSVVPSTLNQYIPLIGPGTLNSTRTKSSKAREVRPRERNG